MKRAFLLLFLFVFFSLSTAVWSNGVADSASTDTIKKPKGVWTGVVQPSLTVNEKLYNNWSAAGNSLLSISAHYDGSNRYTHTHFIVDNVVKLGLAIDMQDLDGNRSLESQRKTLDQIDLTSTFSRKIFDWMNVNASINLKSQFLNGYNYSAAGNDPENATLVSKFFAPAYLTTSIGYEYKTDDWNGSLSFLSGKTTFVLSEDVIAAGQLYGVDTAEGKRYYMGVGSYLKYYFKKDIFPNFNLYTKVELFYDYNKPRLVDWSQESPAYNTYFKRLGRCLISQTDVNIEMTINYKITQWVALTASLNMKYDTDFAGKGDYGHWQLYQVAGLRLFYKWERKP